MKGLYSIIIGLSQYCLFFFVCYMNNCMNTWKIVAFFRKISSVFDADDVKRMLLYILQNVFERAWIRLTFQGSSASEAPVQDCTEPVIEFHMRYPVASRGAFQTNITQISETLTSKRGHTLSSLVLRLKFEDNTSRTRSIAYQSNMHTSSHPRCHFIKSHTRSGGGQFK